MGTDFTKEFFQRSWGPEGYYEEFTYGVGFNEVVYKCLMPFFNINHNALEIGSGGGAFTKKMIKGFRHVTAVDVIQEPEQFKRYSRENFNYIEVEGYTSYLGRAFDFGFSYNCFCHLSNIAIKEYLSCICRFMVRGASFIFMVANFDKNPQGCTGELGDLLPFGHFYQDDRTLDLIIGDGWEIVSRNMIPEHRDIIVHLKKI